MPQWRIAILTIFTFFFCCCLHYPPLSHSSPRERLTNKKRTEFKWKPQRKAKKRPKKILHFLMSPRFASFHHFHSLFLPFLLLLIECEASRINLQPSHPKVEPSKASREKLSGNFSMIFAVAVEELLLRSKDPLQFSLWGLKNATSSVLKVLLKPL